MDGASKKEASPYNLAKERTRTFTYSRKIYTCSTPTLKTNYVWQIHEDADEQRQYFMPCPHCGEHITFAFKQIQFPKGEEGTSNADRAKNAVYVCQECGCIITDRDKIKMLRKGEWRDVKKTCVGKPRKVSFWLNSLYSRFLTWAEIALEFLDSKDDPEKLQNFVNSWLAEPWEDTKLKTTEDTVMERQTELPQYVVPAWARMLTGGVDVQETCVYWTIRAWGNYITSQNIAHGQAMSFQEVERVMNLSYEREDGEKIVVCLCLIDSGYDADSTYDFCASNSDWALPVKGSSNPMASHFKLSKINKPDNRAHGMNLVLVDGDKYKDMIAARMKKENGRGSWMVYEGCDEDYAKQVTAEHKVRTKSGAKILLKWVPKRTHIDNHYLDAEVYALAAADIMEVRSMHLDGEEAEQKQAEQEKAYTPEEDWIKANENWV